MMKELLKPMTGDSDESTREDSDSETGSGGTLGEFASEALGQALSERGGFGIATRILDSLSHSGKTPNASRLSQNGTKYRNPQPR